MRAAPLVAPLLLASLTACQSLAPIGPVAPGDVLDPRDPRPRALLDAFERDAGPKSLRAAAKLTLDMPELRFSRPQRIVAERPAKLRIEVVGLFGQVAGVVATDGARFGFVDLLSGRREHGPVDDGLLWRTARVDLTPSEAVALILGAPRLERGIAILEARAHPNGGIGMRVRGRAQRREHWVEFDGDGHLRRIELFDGAGATVWVARYSDWRAVEEGAFAHELALEFPSHDTRATISFEAVDLDPELPPELFVLHVPAGV